MFPNSAVTYAKFCLTSETVWWNHGTSREEYGPIHWYVETPETVLFHFSLFTLVGFLLVTDNFSGGNRGASSAEYFLEEGYAVIFLHRNRSAMPFQRAFIMPGEDPLEKLDLDDNGQVKGLFRQGFRSCFIVRGNDNEKIKTALQRHHQAKADHKYIHIPFTTIFDYFFWMKRIAELLCEFDESRSLFYSAAAVSDFYLREMVDNAFTSF